MLNRRDFLKTGLTTGVGSLPLLHEREGLAEAGAEKDYAGSITNAVIVPLPARLPVEAGLSRPWQHEIRRVGQTNMTEHDPAVMNVEEWANYWHAMQSRCGVRQRDGHPGFYPSKVPFHRHGKFLNGRDFFGECAAAAKKRGMRVVARMSPDLNWGDALEAHPEWAMRHKDGSRAVQHEKSRGSSRHACSPRYMDDYVPAVMREMNSLYDRGLLLHQRLAAAGQPARVLLRDLQQAAGKRNAGLLARIY